MTSTLHFKSERFYIQTFFTNMLKFLVSILSRYLWAVRFPPQNSAGAKKLGGSPAARKSPIGEG
ncbi:hypothetical protein M3Y14_25810 [Bacillus thuringiensis]|uniref:hypothetical protein n=1 Tax=Bacillus thuringiensis TaxID=1428 RepID=UPI0022249541|nr:hypothetical protein [Bacillus thuringiensis]UYX55533.1 hypothetical protein M3Y14_25810 [Bacillus thuringiensis]